MGAGFARGLWTFSFLPQLLFLLCCPCSLPSSSFSSLVSSVVTCGPGLLQADVPSLEGLKARLDKALEQPGLVEGVP